MPLVKITTSAPTKQAGKILVLLGPKITDLATPSLAAFTLDATCIIRGLGLTTDVSMKETQALCQAEATEEIDRRLRRMDALTMWASQADETQIKALLAEDAEVGIFLRPYLPSSTAGAVADKGWAVNARVASFDPNPIAVGNDFEWTTSWYGVQRNLNATLAV